MKKIIILSFLLTVSCFNYQNNSGSETSEIEYYISDSTKEVDFPFSDATIVNNIIYVSGQVGNIPGETKVVDGGIREETKQTIRNIENILEALGSSLDNVFKCTCMLSDISEWAEMSDEYKKYFSKDTRPSRSAFAGSGLALGAKVEIECWAIK